MKKKIKLFSTIASLCLAVALMAFGVWAATTAKVGVTSTIKYSINGQVNMEMVVTVALKNENGVKVTDGNDEHKTAGKLEWKIAQVPGEEALNATLALGTYEFNDKSIQGDTITYTITITNKAEESLKITASGFTATTTGAVTSATSSQAEGTIAKDASYTYVVVYTLADATKSLDADLTFAPVFDMTVVSA